MIIENETILIIDYGSQYTQLIARKIREQNVYCLVHPYNKINKEMLEKFEPKVLQQNRFNAGVFMLNKNCVDAMKSFLDYKNLQGDDNEQLIYAMLESGVRVDQMDWRYNKKNGTSCYFGHAAGQQKFRPNYDMLKIAKETFDATL